MRKLYVVGGEGHDAPSSAGASSPAVGSSEGVDIDDLLELLAELRAARRLLGPGS